MSKIKRIEREQQIPLPVEEVFEFFGDPMNLERITPAWLNFQVLGASDSPLRAGTTIDYRLRLRGLPIRWTSLISTWDPPYTFVDEQLRGPYTSWVHTHTFEPLGESTLVRDVVEYEVIGGAWIDRFLVRPDLERIFDFRSLNLRSALGSETA